MISIKEARALTANSLRDSDSPSKKERIELLEKRYAKVFTYLDKRILETTAYGSSSTTVPYEEIVTQFTSGEKSENIRYGVYREICDSVYEVLQFRKWNVTRDHEKFVINWS